MHVLMYVCERVYMRVHVCVRIRGSERAQQVKALAVKHDDPS